MTKSVLVTGTAGLLGRFVVDLSNTAQRLGFLAKYDQRHLIGLKSR
jgi:hypothetical protein